MRAAGNCCVGHMPGTNIRTPEIHSPVLIEAERAHISISIKHMGILLLPTLKPAKHRGQCLRHTASVHNYRLASKVWQQIWFQQTNSCPARNWHGHVALAQAAGHKHSGAAMKDWNYRPGPFRNSVPLRLRGTSPSISVIQYLYSFG